MQAKDKIVKARAGLVLDEPFFGSLALLLKLYEDLTCPTTYTNGKCLGYNPNFIDSLTLSETKGVIAHEIMHVALCHHTRRQSRDHKKWNVACDYAINDILVEKFQLPSGALTGFGKEESAESIYNKLPESEDGQGVGFGEVRDAKNDDESTPTEADLKEIESRVKVQIVQAARAAKMYGKLSADLERLVGEITEQKVPWKDVLIRFITEKARDDYTWLYPNKRYIHSGIYLPSLYNEKIGKIIIAVDTSGSIYSEELNIFASEITYIMNDVKADIVVIYCDSAVGNVEEFTYGEEINLHPKGGGGTSFAPPFNKVDELDINPACLVYLTDGYSNSFPKNKPEYPVLWVLTGKNDNFKKNVPFGEVIVIE